MFYFCILQSSYSHNMKIEDLKVATLAYRISDNAPDGAIIENFDETEPLTMMMGVGHMMMSFYEGIIGLESGSSFDFTIMPSKAFGNHDDSLVANVPTDLFLDNGVLQTGLLTPGSPVDIQSDDGQSYKGTVKSVNEDNTVTIDFNHPLSGHTLYVSGKVLDVRNATVEEMDKVLNERIKKGSFRYHGQNCNCKDCQEKRYKKLY